MSCGDGPVDARDGDGAVGDVEDRVAGNERGGVTVRPEAEVYEVEALGKLARVLAAAAASSFSSPASRTSAPAVAGRLSLRWVRLRSGSPAGATRSSTW